MSNATLTNVEGYRADDADLSITIDRSDLETVLMGAATFDAQIDAGKAKLRGNREVYEQLKSTLVTFELGFEIMPGTASPIADVAAGPAADADLNPFEAGPLDLHGE